MTFFNIKVADFGVKVAKLLKSHSDKYAPTWSGPAGFLEEFGRDDGDSAGS